MAIHRNFIEWYWRNWDKLCEEKALPYQNQIFKLFSEKFYTDAEKDWEMWRKLLKDRWNKCAEICNKIHLVLWWNNIVDNELRDLVDNIVNLDYNSLSEIFQTLESKYSEMWLNDISEYINEVSFYLDKMRNISKSRTTIKEE